MLEDGEKFHTIGSRPIVAMTRFKPGSCGKLNKQKTGGIPKMSAEVETMAYVRVVPWHGKGVRVEQAMTAMEALSLGGLDFLVEGRQAYFETEDGTFAPIPYCVANIRQTDNKVLGVVTDRYKICQNVEAFDFLDGVIDRAGGAHYETAGLLYDDGEHRKRGRAFLLAKMDGVEILGDQVDPYICLTNSFNKETGLQVCLTPIRVVCNNTLQMAIDGAQRVWSTTHTGDLKGKMSEAQETLRRIKTYMEKMPVVAEAMFTADLHEDEIPKFLEQLFPLPVTEPGEKVPEIVLKNIENKRQTVYNIYEQVPDVQKFSGTPWGMYNAVTDFSMHYQTFDMNTGYKDSVFTRAINNDPLSQSAQKILMQMCKVRV